MTAAAHGGTLRKRRLPSQWQNSCMRLVVLLMLMGAAGTELLLIRRRRRIAVVPTAAGAGAGYRWGAFCGGLMLFLAILQTVDLLGGFEVLTIQRFEWQLPAKLGFLAVTLAAGIGLTQKRRYGVLALILVWTVFLLPSLGYPLRASVLLDGSTIVFLFSNWIYFRRRWAGLSW